MPDTAGIGLTYRALRSRRHVIRLSRVRRNNEMPPAESFPMKGAKTKKALSPDQREELFKALQARFEKNMNLTLMTV